MKQRQRQRQRRREDNGNGDGDGDDDASLGPVAMAMAAAGNEDKHAGICCSFGKGSYSIELDGQLLFTLVPTRYKIEIDAGSVQCLQAHNSRRKLFHVQNTKRFSSLKWSTELAKDAANWAEKVSSECQYIHEPQSISGENMAIMKYRDKEAGSLKETPERILRRWSDQKEGKGYPDNMTFTQVRAEARLNLFVIVDFYEQAASIYPERELLCLIRS
ncbi:hypothetical protein ACHAWF_005262, partial [Thalassiosira exigua]